MIEAIRTHNVASEIVRVVEYDIKPGTKSNMGTGDEWPGIQKKILAADIIVFATPIWWGNQSSLMQRVIERLDELHTELRETGKSRLTNKVGGIVITGEEDGEQHVTGNISNFLLSIGVTLPPLCAVSYLGDYARATKDSLRKRFREGQADSEGSADNGAQPRVLRAAAAGESDQLTRILVRVQSTTMVQPPKRMYCAGVLRF